MQYRVAFAVHWPQPYIPQLPVELHALVHSYMDVCIAVAAQINIRMGKCVLKGHQAFISSLQFSDCGTLLLSGSYDNTARIWKNQECIQIIRVKHSVLKAGFISQQRVLCVSAKKIHLYDHTGTPLQTVSVPGAKAVVWLGPDQLICYDGHILISMYDTAGICTAQCEQRHIVDVACYDKTVVAVSKDTIFTPFKSIKLAEAIITKVAADKTLIAVLATDIYMYDWTLLFVRKVILPMPVLTIRFGLDNVLLALHTWYAYKVHGRNVVRIVV